MDELLTYELAHFMPFTPEVYARLFARINAELFPAHLAVCATLLLILWRLAARDGRAVVALLAVAWVSCAAAFFPFYAELLWAAPYIAGLFVAQAVLLAIVALRADPNDLRSDSQWVTWAAAGVVLGWPLIAVLSGRSWDAAQLAGLAPDPTAALTIVIFAGARKHGWLIAIPLLWVLLTGLTALGLGQWSGLAAPLCAALAVTIGVIAARRRSSP